MENERKEIVKQIDNVNVDFNIKKESFSEEKEEISKPIKDVEISKSIFSDNFKLLLLISIYVILINLNQRKLFLNATFILSIIFSLIKIVQLYKNTNKNKLFLSIRIIFYILFIKYMIKEQNPFFQLIFFWLPFANFFKGFLMLTTFSYLIHREHENSINSINNFLFGDLIKNSLTPFAKLIKVILILTLVNILLFIYKDQFSHLAIKKESLTNQSYFIAANLFNNEEMLPGWTSEMLKLINYLGKGNCYVSIVENGDSTDGTGIMLKEFEAKLSQLGIMNKIITHKVVERRGYGRIVYLSFLRNKALEFIYQIYGLDFTKTKILFFNDIIFSYKDILKLIDTNNQNYDAVCGLDFYESFYDTWVSFGVDGFQFLRYFPYLRNKVAADRVINDENIRVWSCWNGVVSINATPFDNFNLSFRFPVKFRQSECMLLMTDFWTMNHNKIFVNPNLKFAYDSYYYYMNKYVYPWGKNLFPYFYYYFAYWNLEDNYNFENMSDNNVQLTEEWIEVYNHYLKDD